MTTPYPHRYSLTMEKNTDTDSVIVYEIRLQGHLDTRWRNWFGGFCIPLASQGETVLTGPVADQAALFGVLKKVRDLGLPLLAVNRVRPLAQSQENDE